MAEGIPEVPLGGLYTILNPIKTIQVSFSQRELVASDRGLGSKKAAVFVRKARAKGSAGRRDVATIQVSASSASERADNYL